MAVDPGEDRPSCRSLWVPDFGRRRSGGVSVFVDEAVASRGSNESNRYSRRTRGLVGGSWSWWLLVEGAVGSVLAIVRDVLDHEAFELLAVPDDGAVEELSAQGSDPAVNEGIGHRGSLRADQIVVTHPRLVRRL